MKKSSENEKAVYNYMKYYFKEKGQCLYLYSLYHLAFSLTI